MQARFYAPWYGRFLSPDPARDQHFEETQSWNIYSYCQNIPTMKIDPDAMKDDWYTAIAEKKAAAPSSGRQQPTLPGSQSGRASASTLVSTNPRVRAVVDNVATSMGSKVTYKDAGGRALGPGAGDRGPTGQNQKGDHPIKNAQDFHVAGKTDSQVVQQIKENPALVPPNTQVILHGEFSKPDGTHPGPPMSMLEFLIRTATAEL